MNVCVHQSRHEKLTAEEREHHWSDTIKANNTVKCAAHLSIYPFIIHVQALKRAPDFSRIITELELDLGLYNLVQNDTTIKCLMLTVSPKISLSWKIFKYTKVLLLSDHLCSVRFWDITHWGPSCSISEVSKPHWCERLSTFCPSSKKAIWDQKAVKNNYRHENIQ